MEKEIEKDVAELQMVEHNLQQLLAQKQNVQIQLIEIENAFEELKKVSSNEVYRIVGQIMISSEKSDVEKDLNSKQELLNLKIKNIEKQEDRLRERVQSIQQEVLRKMNKK